MNLYQISWLVASFVLYLLVLRGSYLMGKGQREREMKAKAGQFTFILKSDGMVIEGSLPVECFEEVALLLANKTDEAKRKAGLPTTCTAEIRIEP